MALSNQIIQEFIVAEKIQKIVMAIGNVVVLVYPDYCPVNHLNIRIVVAVVCGVAGQGPTYVHRERNSSGPGDRRLVLLENNVEDNLHETSEGDEDHGSQ